MTKSIYKPPPYPLPSTHVLLLLLLFINSLRVHTTNYVVTLWMTIVGERCLYYLLTTHNMPREFTYTPHICDITARKLLNKSPSSLSSRFLLSFVVLFRLSDNVPFPTPKELKNLSTAAAVVFINLSILSVSSLLLLSGLHRHI